MPSVKQTVEVSSTPENFKIRLRADTIAHNDIVNMNDPLDGYATSPVAANDHQ